MSFCVIFDHLAACATLPVARVLVNPGPAASRTRTMLDHFWRANGGIASRLLTRLFPCIPNRRDSIHSGTAAQHTVAHNLLDAAYTIDYAVGAWACSERKLRSSYGLGGSSEPYTISAPVRPSRLEDEAGLHLCSSRTFFRYLHGAEFKINPRLVWRD